VFLLVVIVIVVLSFPVISVVAVFGLKLAPRDTALPRSF